MLKPMRQAVGRLFGGDRGSAVSGASALPLRTNVAWTFVGNVVYAACQWGMLTVLAKLGSPEMVGQFSLGLAVAAPVIMLANLQLRAVQATDARHEYDFEDYLGLRLVMSLAAFLAIGAIALASSYRRESCLVILAVGLAKGLESLIDIHYGLLQQRERMDRIAQSLMLRGALALAALAAMVLVTGQVLWGVLGMAVVYALALVTYDRRSARLVLGAAHAPRSCLCPRWSGRRLLSLAWLALPLGLVMMLVSLNTNIPRYVIERSMGERELGIYAAMAYLQVAGATAMNALGQAASPRLATFFAAGDRPAYGRLLGRLLAIGAALGLGGVLVAIGFGRHVLSLLYSAEYAKQPEVFAFLMVATGIGYMSSFLSYGITAARRFRPQLPISAAVAGVTALGCAVLVPSQGLLGAALSLTASALLNCCLNAIALLRAFRLAGARVGVEG